ncbi:hypothetical protein V1478_018944 [Vespula squamosa]|uniref:Uncharacterized protein n=1 Tax=Vespula squamosa TaxID=30214 RepID=A0ABD1ZSV7_VESSQ
MCLNTFPRIYRCCREILRHDTIRRQVDSFFLKKYSYSGVLIRLPPSDRNEHNLARCELKGYE